MSEKLKFEELYRICDPEIFSFKTTEELAEFRQTIGQERAINAIDFGLSLNNIGYNILYLVSMVQER